ncbi:MAG: tRNA (adenosine(37)-N6)-threonylcarbamoyltransferase complex ATPase subunit type 1 TsaE [Rhodocyclaceae bacterium]|nr:tRNA (adenosine(37)-N6)-threonylcarbamoyltransferase complex ATPase subunit type 1 TsaE [Rhodocyclaceae bacterium]
MHPADDTRRAFALPDERATLALGAAIAQALPQAVAPAAVICLEGDLGAGKTTLVRGLLRQLGVAGAVKSPTYTLVELHAISRLNCYHFDFYRFAAPEEFLDAGLDEYFADKGWCLVEWPDRARPYLPACDWRIELTVTGNGRFAQIEAASERGRQWLSHLAAAAGSFSPPG